MRKGKNSINYIHIFHIYRNLFFLIKVEPVILSVSESISDKNIFSKHSNDI